MQNASLLRPLFTRTLVPLVGNRSSIASYQLENVSHKGQDRWGAGHKIGKFANLINPNHRHDEKHEKETDEKRTKISQSHRFGSFAPERPGNNIKWYVDGRDYFWAVSVALDRAKETIYIADWWLSPELFLRRPPHQNQEWRIDQVLKRRAEAGVKIYIIIYREVAAALTCNSEHTKHAMQGLCPEGSPGHGNIHIMRHPDHNVFENVSDMTFYWAHHEKLIVIDYELAFIGGLDLCFGRWDLHQHSLSDVHPTSVADEIWPGQDFNNNRVMDFKDVQDWKTNELSKAEYGRMPWHDVHMGLVGDCVYDIAEHFVLRWNFIKRDKYKRDRKFDWITLEGREGPDEDLIGVQRPKHPVGEYIRHPISPLTAKGFGSKHGTVTAQVVRSSADWSSGILTEHSIQNAYSEVIRNAEHYVAIVDAVVRAAKEGRTFRVIAIIPSVPGFAGDLRDDAAIGTRAIMDYQYKSICRGEHSIFEQIRAQGVDPTKYVFFFNLRSYDRLNNTPQMKKKEEESGVKYQDVQRAEAEEIMGEGIHGSTDARSRKDRHIRKKSSDSTAEGKEERVQARRKFEAAGGEEREPISTDSVAGCAMLNQGRLVDQQWDGPLESEVENWIQEELYVHGKLLIVDDRTVICGSSNINDRSQLGDHDSELSIVMTDTKMLKSTMAGKSYEAGYHAATLRRYLWREHLGLVEPQELDAGQDPNAQPPDVPNDPHEDQTYEFVADPLSDNLWDMWTKRASVNTDTFRELFHADPDNHVKSFQDYDRFLPPRGVKAGHIFNMMMKPEEVRAKLDQIKGHLVWMPMDFLQDAEMAEPGLQVNSWTQSVYA
ncbi:hypothetical protein B7463_g7885, partial [Scytalidium lignicola]